jgi:methyltransferase
MLVMTLIFFLVFVPLLLEARRSAQNESALRSRGGIEAERDVYPIMRFAYPAALGMMLIEGALGGRPSPIVVATGAVLFAVSKALKWWAILTLGLRWTFRVITLPGLPLVKSGPYRYLSHPNYIAVVSELAAVAIMTRARGTGPIAVLGFGLLMLRRISIEERALGANGQIG